jgi:hypothetical protein
MIVTAALSACVAGSAGDDGPRQCEETSDCDAANGEICDEGICWGDPPDTAFAGVLRPTGESTPLGLVTTELPSLSIATDGTIDGLQLVEPVAVDAKVTVFCSALTDGIPCGSEAPIAASIRVERPALFPGGPRFVQTFTTNPGADPSVRMLLPPTGEEENLYTVIITPLPPNDDDDAAAPNYARIAPKEKLQQPLKVLNDTQIEWIVGHPDKHKFVSACLRSDPVVNEAFKGMKVSATIDDGAGGELRISTVDRTDSNGCFSIRVRDGLESFNLVFDPKAGQPDPKIRVVDEPLPQTAPTTCYAGGPVDAICMPDIIGPDLATAQSVTVPIKSTNPSGGEVGVTGASVRFFANLPVDDPRGSRVSATIEVLTTSSANSETPGQAIAMLRPNVTYDVSVIPGPDSVEFAALFGHPVNIQQPGVQAEIRLGRRVAVTGTLLDAAGNPIALAPITAEPTISYRLAQDSADRPLIQSLTASDVTTENGTFLLWLDGPLDLGPAGLGDPVVYNLVTTPPLKSGAPRWRFENISAVAFEGGSMELGELVLPSGSFARGLVTTDDGTPVSGVSLHIYEPNSADLCAGQVPPSECPASAREVGNWLSDPNDSVVRVVLPDP